MKSKKLLLSIISCMLIISTCPTVFATTYSDNEAEQNQEITTTEDLNLTAADEREYIEYQDGLAESIESEILSGTTSQTDIGEAISQYVDENADQNIVTDCKEASGISNKSKKISCKVKCSPSGKITKSYYPAL